MDDLPVEKWSTFPIDSNSLEQILTITKHAAKNLHTHLRILLALFAVSLITANLNAAKRPNILWIVGENFSNDLGCYGQDNGDSKPRRSGQERSTLCKRILNFASVCS